MSKDIVQSGNNSSPLNFVTDKSTFNPNTTEHVQLFNKTAIKKKSPTMKISITEIQKATDIQLQSIVNGNVSYELLPDIVKNISKDSIIRSLENLSKKFSVSFENYYHIDSDIDVKNNDRFHNSIEIYLRELQFQEEFISKYTDHYVDVFSTRTNVGGMSHIDNLHNLNCYDIKEYKNKETELEKERQIKEKQIHENLLFDVQSKRLNLNAKSIEQTKNWDKEIADIEERYTKIQEDVDTSCRMLSEATQKLNSMEGVSDNDIKLKYQCEAKVLQCSHALLLKQEQLKTAKMNKQNSEKNVLTKKENREQLQKKIEEFYTNLNELKEKKLQTMKEQQIKTRELKEEQTKIQHCEEEIRKTLTSSLLIKYNKDREERIKQQQEYIRKIADEQKRIREAEIERKRIDEEKRKSQIEHRRKAFIEQQANKIAQLEELKTKEAQRRADIVKQRIADIEKKNKEYRETIELQQKMMNAAKREKVITNQRRKEIELKREESKKQAEHEHDVLNQQLANACDIASKHSNDDKSQRLLEYRKLLHNKRNNTSQDIENKTLSSSHKQLDDDTTLSRSIKGISAGALTKLLMVFNFDFYRSNYEDAKHFSISQALEHYLSFGKEEGRVISKKHAQHITGCPDFDIIYYRETNKDIQHLSLRDLCIHYNNIGKKEKREIKEGLLAIHDYRECSEEVDEKINLIDTESTISDLKTHDDDSSESIEDVNDTNYSSTTHNICIIYPYYEKKNHTKNQTNLAYFLKYGMDKTLWRKNIHVTLLLIINGHNCELNLPVRDDIMIWKRDYNNEYDIGSYKLGIEYIESIHQEKLYDVYDYLFIMNSSVMGPFCKSDNNTHWLDPFINKIEQEDSVICSPVINFLSNRDRGGPGPRCQTYCSLILMNKTIYNLLLDTKVSRICEDSLLQDEVIRYANVFDVHKTHSDIILFGEYGFTRVFTENGYNISCLSYDNINYNDKQLWNKYSDRNDRADEYTEELFYKRIFIKNNWVVGDTFRDSLPVLYDLTINETYKQLSLVDFIKKHTSPIHLDYESLQISPTGDINLGLIKSLNVRSSQLLLGCWVDKQEFYNLFGYSEEVIIFPKQNKNNRSVCIYTHIDSDNTIRDYVIQGLKTLIIMNYDIIFCTTLSEISNVTLPFKVRYYNFDTPLSNFNEGHIKMLYDVVTTTNLSNYDNVLSLNNNLVFPCHGISNMDVEIKDMNSRYDAWMLYKTSWDVPCGNTYANFSKKTIPLLIHFMNKINNHPSEAISVLYEKYLINTLSEKTPKIGFIVTNPNLYPIRYCLRNTKCFGVLLKSVLQFLNRDNDIKNPVLRFLLRYLNI